MNLEGLQVYVDLFYDDIIFVGRDFIVVFQPEDEAPSMFAYDDQDQRSVFATSPNHRRIA